MRIVIGPLARPSSSTGASIGNHRVETSLKSPALEPTLKCSNKHLSDSLDSNPYIGTHHLMMLISGRSPLFGQQIPPWK
jgi:hypothetical protein